MLLGDVHAAACGIKIEGPRALRCIPGFVDGLNGEAIEAASPFFYPKYYAAFSEGGTGETALSA